MDSAVPLHRAPAAGFDEPFAMLAACHERVERMLGLLQRLQAHLRSAGADRQARDAARDVMRYFDIAAPLHHEDEEHHVFPRLRACGLGALADRLHADHEAMSPAWEALRRDLLQVADGRVPDLDAGRWEAFVALYRRHLDAEDAEAFPQAADGADADARAAMGAEMARRRGL
jgi:hemerythrin-like domain-containing protein